jgi:hypothetical protein
MAILATIFSIIYMSFATTIETKMTVEAGNDLYGMARLAMDRMTRELSMAYVRTATRRDETNPTLFLGEDHEASGYPIDALVFTSVSHVRLGFGARESDQNEIGYFVVDDSATGDRVLTYREDAIPDAENTEGGVVYELCRSLYGINFRYWDPEKEEWIDDWDSRAPEREQAPLPQAVEITLILRDDRNQELIFQTKVMVRR